MTKGENKGQVNVVSRIVRGESPSLAAFLDDAVLDISRYKQQVLSQ
jgi:hypothetical protein